MNLKRILRHLTTLESCVQRAFPSEVLTNIEQAIAASENTHAGQICVAVEGALAGPALLRGQSARERAIEVFSHLRIWDTEQNNGVLIYLLLADRDVEIVADRGIHARVTPSEWDAICQRMEAAFRQDHYADGIIDGIRTVAEHLSRHFPATGVRRDELPNRPVVF